MQHIFWLLVQSLHQTTVCCTLLMVAAVLPFTIIGICAHSPTDKSQKCIFQDILCICSTDNSSSYISITRCIPAGASLD